MYDLQLNCVQGKHHLFSKCYRLHFYNSMQKLENEIKKSEGKVHTFLKALGNVTQGEISEHGDKDKMESKKKDQSSSLKAWSLNALVITEVA